MNIVESGKGKFSVFSDKTGERLGVFLTMGQAEAFEASLQPVVKASPPAKKKGRPSGSKNKKKE